MKRRTFLQATTLASTGFLAPSILRNAGPGPIYGHGTMRYRMNADWGKLDPEKFPVNDCHEMVQDAKGRIYLLTNETRNNVLIYDKSGRLLDSWGHDFPGGHGLTITDENGEEFLFLTDTAKNQVYKTTLSGRLVRTIDYPKETGKYSDPRAFVPTETAVADNGDLYIADGYGSQWVTRYNHAGDIIGIFGGPGDKTENLENAHGVSIDRRNDPHTVIVTDRTRNCFKRFSLDGTLLGVIALPGACVCRPVIRGDYLYAAVLTSPNLGAAGTGFVTILDRRDRVVSNIGGTEPTYRDGILQPMAQAEKIFVHPHDVMVDDEGSLYVAQWNSKKVYPYKFTKVT